ncbi:MAG TPA: superoxide dismutase family protein [Vicinamibacterales bacterium]|jgi:Cu-Zn family superoxide dismutase
MKTLVTIAALLLAASIAGAQAPATASATINDAMGKMIGTATLRENSSGVLIKVDFTGAPAGTHALHVHTTGKCDAPMFMTAGGHFAPGMTKHGLFAAGGPHAGDLPNIYVPADGKLSMEILEANVTLAAGPRSLLDADGSAIVLHAMADDYMTDPAGNAGGRIACGVINK